MQYFFGLLTVGFALALLVEIVYKPRTKVIILSSVFTVLSAGGLAWVLL
jgi:hypothetical protein